MNSGGEVSILIAFSAGLLTFLSPCVLPLFPSYLSYISGRSFEEIKNIGTPKIRLWTALHSLFFILGFSLVFTLLGIAFAYLGNFFGIKKIWLEKIGGIIIILFGLNIMGVLKIGFWTRAQNSISQNRKLSYLGSSLMGMAFAFTWMPCVDPVLGSILVYASTLNSIGKAAGLLICYSLGLGVPFFLSSLAVNQFLFIFNKFKKFARVVPIVTGAFLILVGNIVFWGGSAKLIRIFVR
jgi:cytochrome c-type biogenesis protein